MTWQELTFEPENFYPYNDNTEFHRNILSQCKHIDELKVNQHTINNLGNCSIFHINCGSLNAKFDSINTYLASLNTKFDVLCFTES